LSKLSNERLATHETTGTTESETETSGINTGRQSGQSAAAAHVITPWNINQNEGESSGQSRGTSTSKTKNVGQQLMNERKVKPHELAALDRDETVIFGEGGAIDMTITPQPDLVAFCAAEYQEARRAIEGESETESEVA
jgi:hypothetical protein